MFGEKGYERASVAEIAARVGIVEGALYNHFEGKRALLYETVRAFYEPVIAETRAQLTSIEGTRARLRYVIRRQLRGFAEDPALCRLIIQDVRPHADYRSSVVRELNREATSLALRVLQEGIDRGEFRSDVPPTLVRDVIFGGIEHVMWRALAGEEPPDVDRLADALTDLVLRGIETRPGGSPRVPDPAVRRLEERVDRLERRIQASPPEARAGTES